MMTPDRELDEALKKMNLVFGVDPTCTSFLSTQSDFEARERVHFDCAMFVKWVLMFHYGFMMFTVGIPSNLSTYLACSKHARCVKYITFDDPILTPLLQKMSVSNKGQWIVDVKGDGVYWGFTSQGVKKMTLENWREHLATGLRKEYEAFDDDDVHAMILKPYFNGSETLSTFVQIDLQK